MYGRRVGVEQHVSYGTWSLGEMSDKILDAASKSISCFELQVLAALSRFDPKLMILLWSEGILARLSFP